DTVRIITFDSSYSSELCGGTHVNATGELGLFKIVSESAVAAGIRRIEAVTAAGAEAFVNGELNSLNEVRGLFKGTQDVVKSVATLQEENRQLKKELEKLKAAEAQNVKVELKNAFQEIDGLNFLAEKVSISDAAAIKNLAFQLEKEVGSAFVLLGSENEGKALLTLAISKNLTTEKGLHAGNIVREIAKNIKGGGGGQPFFATAGGKDPNGLGAALKAAREML
ncbi:MAG: DHHA1 domain-containing protein, partial [Bacteroidota bacterium]